MDMLEVGEEKGDGWEIDRGEGGGENEGRDGVEEVMGYEVGGE